MTASLNIIFKNVLAETDSIIVVATLANYESISRVYKSTQKANWVHVCVICIWVQSAIKLIE